MDGNEAANTEDYLISDWSALPLCQAKQWMIILEKTSGHVLQAFCDFWA